MSKYELQSNESVILKQDRILHGGVMASFTDELILTNINIVLISKGVFGNTKRIQTFPLNQIKIFDGQAQALLGKTGGGYPQLDVYFFNGQESFGFESKREALKWVSNINKLVTGNDVKSNTTSNMAVPGSAYVAETIKGTVDTFKETFGFKSKSNKEMDEKTVTKCKSCGAPISGDKGQIVRCQYCDSDHQL